MTRTFVPPSEQLQPQIDLGAGWPNPLLLPPRQLNESANVVFGDSELSKESLRYATDLGYLPLRQELVKLFKDFYGPKYNLDVDQLYITGGASQNLACILQAFTDPVYTRNIWMVAPTYFLACGIMDDSGFSGRLRAVPEDHEGIDIDFLRSQIRVSEEQAIKAGNTKPMFKTSYQWRRFYKHIIYAVPTFANPSGRVMSRYRREALVRLARQYDALIITDDVYDMLHWPKVIGAASEWKAIEPRLIDIDQTLDGGPIHRWGNTLSNGSFSKLVAPGCRTGWAQASSQLVWALSQSGSNKSGCPPSAMAASLIHQMLARGDLATHIRSLILAYQTRYTRMLQAIETYLVPLGVKMPQSDLTIAGGYFIWLNLPKPLTGVQVAQRALRTANLIVIAGPQFRVEGDEAGEKASFDREIRLCFSYERRDLLKEGVIRLAHVIKAEIADHTGSTELVGSLVGAELPGNADR